MKRMYITLTVILIVLVWAVAALSQNQTQTLPQTRQPFDRMKRRMELREEMHRRIREKLLHGRGADQDLFKDLEQQFEDTMSESFSGIDQLGDIAPNFKSEWQESKTGRTMVITPKDPNQKINIDVNATTITIKGESQQQTATTSFTSAFTNSFPVPGDCDGTKVKMDSKDGKLLIELPFKSLKAITTKPKEEERKPLPPTGGEVQI
ncbi:MAG: Hsp20 family protein [Bdellovibrionales bacterium]|nr:Hsp20 family protein [Bdellovibrionales bacterium]